MKATTPNGRCQVCRSSDRAVIEISIARGVSGRALGKRFNLAKDTIHRHKAHMSPAILNALKARRLRTELDLDRLRREESEGLTSNLIGQRGRLSAMIADSLDIKDFRVAVSCERALLDNLIASARILGEIGGVVTNVQNNLLVAPDYLRLRATLIEVLRPFREARIAVSRALSAIESTKQIAPPAGAVDIAGAGQRDRASLDHNQVVAGNCPELLQGESCPAPAPVCGTPDGALVAVAGPPLLSPSVDVAPEPSTSVITLVR